MLGLPPEILLLGFIACVFVAQEWFAHWSAERKYRKDKERFYKEVARGIAPDWHPIKYGADGSISIDTNDLGRTAQFRKMLASVARGISKTG